MAEEFEEEKEGGLTFGEIMRAVGKRIWWIVGASALITIIAILALVFFLNPNSVTYELTFNVNYPESDSLKYPDGTDFAFLDLVSLENLEEAKKSDAEFSGINVEKMFNDDGITVEQVTKKVGTTEEEEVVVGKYTFKVNGKYFSDKNEATKFLRALAEVPIDKVVALVEKADFEVSLQTYADEQTYGGKIEALAAQKNYLIGRYNVLIDFLGDDYEAQYEDANGRAQSATLRSLRSRVSLVFTSTAENAFRTEFNNNRYIYNKDKTNLTIIQTEIDDITLKITQNEKLKETLTAQRSALIEELARVGAAGGSTLFGDTALGDYTKRINDLEVENNSLTKSREILQNALDEAKVSQTASAAETDFFERLETEKTDLAALSKTCKIVAVTLYNSESNIKYDTVGAVADGGYSVLIVSIAAFILTFLLASFVVCLIEIPKMRKEQAAADVDFTAVQAPNDGKAGEKAEAVPEKKEEQTEENGEKKE